ncbi:enoyl-CoA hydratase/isomerase family protein, partial [Streptomyces sp. NPDC048845]|uniref:enoyl-CoA hydratase/isomerase family protein n=1 Tax=Streptomyces sp. NPDC048845 TaxID=3155390 RepID=UPI003440AA2A
MVLPSADGSAESAAPAGVPVGTSAGTAASAHGPAGPDDGSPGSVLCRVAEGVATLTLHRPAKRNAMTAAMWRRLPELLERLAADPAVRVVLLTGSGGTFCAGADIGELGDETGVVERFVRLAPERLGRPVVGQRDPVGGR